MAINRGRRVHYKADSGRPEPAGLHHSARDRVAVGMLRKHCGRRSPDDMALIHTEPLSWRKALDDSREAKSGNVFGQTRRRPKMFRVGLAGWKALDTRPERFVALKVLPADKVSDPERKRRFEQEAKAASALNHPN